MTEGNGVNPAGSSSRLDRIENALEVLIAQQQALTAQQQALTAQQQELAVRQEVFMQSTNERLDRHEQMITNAVLGYVNMGEALMERIDAVVGRVDVLAGHVEVIAQRVEVMAEQVVRIVTHLDTVSLQVLGLQTENRRILDILQGR